jgi:6-phosphogluconate dehydrogenase
MQIGMVGLGRMGGNMVRRLMRGGHQCVVSDLTAANVAKLASEEQPARLRSMIFFRS